MRIWGEDWAHLWAIEFKDLSFILQSLPIFHAALSPFCFELNEGSRRDLLLAFRQVAQSSFAFSKHPHTKPPAIFCDVEQFISSLLFYQPLPVYNLLVLADSTAWVCKVPFKRPEPCDMSLAGPKSSSCTCQPPSPTFCR
ncbi:hypothetical protein MHYP_G00134600 [Metynnis hypsauchen]